MPRYPLIALLLVTLAWNFVGSYFLGSFQRNLGALDLVRATSTSSQQNRDQKSREESLAGAFRHLERAASLHTAGSADWRLLGLAHLSAGQEQAALDAWQQSDRSAAWMIAWGERFRFAGELDEAARWFRRAMVLAPTWSDAYYYLGRVQQAQNDWSAALSAYTDALEMDNFVDVSVSDVFLYVGDLYRRGSTPRDLAQAQTMYDKALAQDTFSGDGLLAQTNYRRGEIVELQNHDPAEAIPYYRAAIRAQENHRWSHLRLGRAIYATTGDITAARLEIDRAKELWHQDRHQKFPYQFMGDIYRDAGETELALVEYRQALELAPEDAQLQSLVSELANQ